MKVTEASGCTADSRPAHGSLMTPETGGAPCLNAAMTACWSGAAAESASSTAVTLAIASLLILTASSFLLTHPEVLRIHERPLTVATFAFASRRPSTESPCRPPAAPGQSASSLVELFRGSYFLRQTIAVPYATTTAARRLQNAAFRSPPEGYVNEWIYDAKTSGSRKNRPQRPRIGIPARHDARHFRARAELKLTGGSQCGGPAPRQGCGSG